uniref:VWFA domain-containing protein n=1 Tax=Pseudonaja textilis TaxID=8673 RepID=A0A670YPU1_PSETE
CSNIVLRCIYFTGSHKAFLTSPVSIRSSFTFFFPPPETKCKTGALDIVFVIDSSRSVRPYEFETMRRFMIDIIHNLDIGPNATRVGVIQYSSQVQNIFSLKSFFTRAEMEKAINSIVPLAQGTMTGLAIQYAMNVAFTVQNGARPLHRKIPRVAVIVTDGRPQDRVTEVAAQARAAGIEIYAVGVQRADMNSLRAMASPPLEEHVFLVENIYISIGGGVGFIAITMFALWLLLHFYCSMLAGEFWEIFSIQISS